MTADITADIFTKAQTEQLSDKLDPRNVKVLKQGSKASYIEGWHAIAEANRIFGFGSWDRELVRCEETNRELLQLEGKKQWRVGYIYVCRITVYGAHGECRKREGTGFGSGFAGPNQLGEAIESAIKEAETDAMKRALMTLGNPFGLALYDKSKAMVGAPEHGEEEVEEAPAPKALSHDELVVLYKKLRASVNGVASTVELDAWPQSDENYQPLMDLKAGSKEGYDKLIVHYNQRRRDLVAKEKELREEDGPELHP